MKSIVLISCSHNKIKIIASYIIAKQNNISIIFYSLYELNNNEYFSYWQIGPEDDIKLNSRNIKTCNN